MTITCDFLSAAVDTLTEHIAILDTSGAILFVNQSWRSFGLENSAESDIEWIGINYLQICDNSATAGDHHAHQAKKGLQQLFNREIDNFYLEYPCHSPTEKRWFILHANPFQLDEELFIVVSHSNITQRKLAEEEITRLSRIDDLTSLANRRYFNAWFPEEWRRCSREKVPLSLAIMDIDFFKDLNDKMGHLAGDSCIKSISGLLRFYSRRPSDICARYGGDEFIIVYGNTGNNTAITLLTNLQADIQALNIANPRSPFNQIATVSIGLLTIIPNRKTDPFSIIRKADDLLYSAKQAGRNCLETAEIQDISSDKE